jgi:hypothetical protein
MINDAEVENHASEVTFKNIIDIKKHIVMHCCKFFFLEAKTTKHLMRRLALHIGFLKHYFLISSLVD